MSSVHGNSSSSSVMNIRPFTSLSNLIRDNMVSELYRIINNERVFTFFYLYRTIVIPSLMSDDFLVKSSISGKDFYNKIMSIGIFSLSILSCVSFSNLSFSKSIFCLSHK